VNEIPIYGRHLSRITRSQELEEAAARVQQEVTAAFEEAERVGNPGRSPRFRSNVVIARWEIGWGRDGGTA
jgi:hypothetical protein